MYKIFALHLVFITSYLNVQQHKNKSMQKMNKQRMSIKKRTT